jgi:hypothetical protein
MYAEDEEPQDELGGVYQDEGREDLMKDDEISPEEEAFMAGYDTEEEKKEETTDIYDEAFDKASAAAGPKRKPDKPAPKKTASKKLAGSKNKSFLKAKPKPKIKAKPAKKAPAKKSASKKLAGSKNKGFLKAKPKPKIKAKAKPAKKKGKKR